MLHALFRGNNGGASLGRDFLASIVVFLVALPLCLGIAIASGVPPALGLVTGIIGGIVVGAIAGCPLQVSGPAAGLVAIVWEAVQHHGLETFGVILLLAGTLQLAAGVLQLGQWFRAVSPSVIFGMLAGIGVLIFASQFHIMVDDTPKSNGVENLLSIPMAIYKGIFPLEGTTHHFAAGVGLLTIVTIILWNYVPAKLKLIPGALLGVVLAVIVSSLFKLPINYVTIPADLFSSLTIASWDGVLNAISNGSIWLAAFTIAFVASAETMLTATAIDQMNCGPKTSYNRELTAQGIGNMLCGFVGALPMTGVIVRSATNVDAGATSRLSTMLHGVWILLLVLAFPWVLNKIPTASLAAVLVYTGYKLVNPKTISKLMPYGKSEVAIYLITLTAVVVTNLLEGVLIGLGLALLKVLYTLSHLDTTLLREPDEEKATLILKGSATFVNLPRLAGSLDRVPAGLELHIRYEQLSYVDHACLELLASWEKQYINAGGTVFIEWDGLKARVRTPQTEGTNESEPAPAKALH